MPDPVREYEVEIGYQLDGQQLSRGTSQWAYNVMDAMQQAIFMIGNEIPKAKDFRVVRIGPPQRLIDAAMGGAVLEAVHLLHK